MTSDKEKFFDHIERVKKQLMDQGYTEEHIMKTVTPMVALWQEFSDEN